MLLEDLSILMVTYNVNGQYPEEDVSELLEVNVNFQNSNDLPDIYAIGFQEAPVKPSSLLFLEDPWVGAFKRIITKWDYLKLKKVRMHGILLVVFVKRRLLPDIRDIETQITRTGFRGFWGNKGGVSVRFTLNGVSICIVNSHLAAHMHEVQHRVHDYNSILQDQVFPEHLTPKILSHDYVLWMGDLNFRIDDLSKKEIEMYTTAFYQNNDQKKAAISHLLDGDQLNKLMNEGKIFCGFRETVPTFMPTFKFVLGSNDHDLQRKPAFCDRILYRVLEDVYENVKFDAKQIMYKSHPRYTTSDHKPVSSRFILKIFKRSAFSCLNLEKPICISFYPFMQWKIRENNDAWFTISNEPYLRKAWDEQTISSKLSQMDRVALFKADFSSLSDFISYVWVNPMPESNTTKDFEPSGAPTSSDECPEIDLQKSLWFKVTFTDHNIPAHDAYRLLYLSNHMDNVLGMSSPFHLA